MITVPMTTAEAVHVRQAIDTARRFNPGMFDQEQDEALVEVERRIAEHVDTALARRLAFERAVNSLAEALESAATAVRSTSTRATAP